MRKLRLKKEQSLDDSALSKSSAIPKHESAIKHVTGRALFVDDVPETHSMLHVATGYAHIVCGKIRSIDLSKVRAYEGVVDVITYADIPGDPDISPVYSGDLLLANERVEFHGQPVFAVAATSLRVAKQAVLLAEIDCEQEAPVLTPQQAIEKKAFLMPPHQFATEPKSQRPKSSENKLSNSLYVKGQEHFYLEGQISVATPTEDGGVSIISSSQHPAEVQKLAASVLGLSINQVQAEVLRMGGAFGGKESQAAMLSCMAAVFAVRTQRAVKYRMPRQDDFMQTGKRHDFWNQYQVDFDAFRGFGGPKGVIAAEAMLDDIARAVGKDPLDVRKINCYQSDRNLTPYGQTIEQEVLLDLINRLELSSGYRQRRKQITEFNKSNRLVKRGLALTPVKFGISFTSKHLNQAGALVHVYTDGSIHLNHGGTEMGQGLNTKIAQIVARGFGVNLERVALVTNGGFCGYRLKWYGRA